MSAAVVDLCMLCAAVVGLVEVVRGNDARGNALLACAFSVRVVVDLAEGSQPWFDALLAAVFAWLWWRNRRKGGWRRAARELGAKSRARVQALARQMTPSTPSPAGAV